MNDPEAPVIDDREISGAVIEECRHIEDWDREPRKKEKHRELASLGVFERRSKCAIKQSHPDHKPGRQPDLPRFAEIEIFPSLIAKPLPQSPQHLLDTKPLSKQAARYNYNEG